jgi:saccharopine dehydrogenase-like NADP-dependent oxidoreductase
MSQSASSPAADTKANTAKSSGTVLLLGCGLVAPPLIHYLSEHGVSVIVASRTKAKTEKVIAGLKGVTAVEWDIDQK